jgi:hypothetical protein
MTTDPQPSPATAPAAHMQLVPPVPLATGGADLDVMDVSESIESTLARLGSTIADVARVVWAARDLLASWDAAQILGLASASGAHVPAVLARVEGLRAALAGRPL